MRTCREMLGVLVIVAGCGGSGCGGAGSSGSDGTAGDAPSGDPDATGSSGDSGGGGGGDSGTTGPDAAGVGDTSTEMVGSGGGSLDVDGATLDIPAGALAGDVLITITKTTEVAPTGSATASAVYALSPAGQVFTTPVTFTLHVGAPPPLDYHIAWSKAGVANPSGLGDYELRPSTISGNDISATNTHFSKVFGDRFLATRRSSTANHAVPSGTGIE
jgi:hypothetical protein